MACGPARPMSALIWFVQRWAVPRPSRAAGPYRAHTQTLRNPTRTPALTDSGEGLATNPKIRPRAGAQRAARAAMRLPAVASRHGLAEDSHVIPARGTARSTQLTPDGGF